MSPDADLSTVATALLEDAHRELVRRGSSAPLSERELASWGLDEEPRRRLLGVLGGLDPAARIALLEVVLAERRARRSRAPELVWTGPDPLSSKARDTRVLVRSLLAAARERVLIAGYAFDHGRELFGGLHEAMRDRGVHTDIYLNIEQPDGPVVGSAEVARQRRAFLDENWPFGPPWPSLYHDTRVLDAGIYASLHAKCLVVDRQKALITSANFTMRGQERNIEVGVPLDDRDFAEYLVEQFRQATAAGLFLELDP